MIQQRLLPTDTCPGPSAVETDRQEVGSSWRWASGEAGASGDIAQNGICLQFVPCPWVCLTSVIDTHRGAKMKSPSRGGPALMAHNIPETTKRMNECVTLEKGMPSGRLPVRVGTAERGPGREHPGGTPLEMAMGLCLMEPPS